MNKLFIILVVVICLTGCASAPSTPTLPTAPTLTLALTPTISAPTSTLEPTTGIPAEVQSQLDILNPSGINGYEYRDGKIYNSEGSVISVDSLGAITTPAETGLSWWNSENKSWVVVDPINPETYPKIYLEHWNSLATRTPVSEATAEDIAFNDFQIETYRDFFPSIQSNLNQDPLWQTFFQANGSDFSAMSADQIYQASLLYGRTSKEVIMPIVLMEQQNQANPDNWKFSYETKKHDGIVFPAPESEIDFATNLFKERGQWGFSQNLLGTIIPIDNIPLNEMRGIVQAQFRIPGVNPDTEVGLVVSFDDGKHLDVSVSFEDLFISMGDNIIGYYELNIRKIISPSPDEKIFPALDDQWNREISPQEIKKEIIGTSRTLFIQQEIGDSSSSVPIDIFSKNSGLQLVGTIFTTRN